MTLKAQDFMGIITELQGAPAALVVLGLLALVVVLIALGANGDE